MNINNRKCVAWFALGATIFATVAFMLGSTHFNTNQFSFSTGSGTPKAWIKDGALLTNTSIRGLTLPAGLLISGYDGVDGYVWTRTNANGSGHWAPAGAGGGASNAVAEINGGTNAQQWFEIANSGTDVTITTTAVGSKATNKINIPTASAVNRGVVSSADWSTFAGKQASNAALASLAAHGAVTNLNGLDGDSQTLATGTGGSDFAIASAGTAHTFNLPTASAVNRGALSAADWAAFAAKQASNANTAAWANVGTNQFARTNELQTGKTLLVDAVFGNDTTAKRENGKPFATLSNAVAVAQTWDTIKVRSGYHYGTTTLTMPIGVHLIGEGKEATIIHIERFNTGHAIGMKASNYFGSFTIITTNYDNNTYTVPFDGANLTNVVFENVRCSGYYDNWKIAGNGRATIKFFNCESFAAYDSFNVTANTNCTLEFYGGRYLSDFTLGGAVTPFDCRVIAASFSARIRAYGTSFEARNYAVAQAFQVYPTFLDSPPGRSLQDVDVQLFGCKIYSDGTAIRNMEDLYNEAVEVTNALPSGIYRLDGCQVVGEIRGPVWGSFTGSNFVNVGHANAFSTATDGGFVVSAYPPGHSGFIVGVSNLLTTNGGIVGFNLTNPANNTLDIGVSNATKTTFSHNGVTVRSPLTVNNALSAQNLQVGSATITESIFTFADGATITEVSAGVVGVGTSLQVQGGTASPSRLDLYETNGTFSSAFEGPTQLTNNITWFMPTNPPAAGVTNLAIVAITSGGTGVTNRLGYVAGGAGSTESNVVLRPTTSTRNLINPTNDVIPLVIKHFTDATQPYLEMRDSADAVAFQFTPSGRLGIGVVPSYSLDVAGGAGVNALAYSLNGQSAFGVLSGWLNLAPGFTTTGSARGERLYISRTINLAPSNLDSILQVNEINNTAHVGLQIRSIAAQTANSFEILTNGTTPNFYVDALGRVMATNGVSSFRSNLAAPASISFPATTVNWTNPLNCKIEVYIDNTGVTATAINKNGTKIFTTGNATFGLQVGEYFSETYSAGTPVGTYSPF